MHRDTLIETAERLIHEGGAVLSTEFDAGGRHTAYARGRPRGVEITAFSKWQAGCGNLMRMLGDAGETWSDNFAGKRNTPANTKRMLGTLQAIKESLEDNLLLTVEDLIRAEAFQSLLEQAKYLLAGGYYLAAGVLGRAALEEHLRSLCRVSGCSPAKAKPTLNDFKDELYKAKHLNLGQMKHVEAMASIGNNAAHNNPELTLEEVKRLIRDVQEFLAKNSLT